MSEGQIHATISQLRSEISGLESELTMYYNMNSKINQAIPYLEDSKSNLNTASSEVMRNYNNDGIAGDQGKINEMATQVNDKIVSLNTMLAVSNSQIFNIQNSITSKHNEISRLEQELATIAAQVAAAEAAARARSTNNSRM